MPWRRISDETKLSQGRGTGRYENYKPWIRFAETGSDGTGGIQPDWKTGRGVQCLSRGELLAWALLRWEKDVDDIMEQYPLMRLDITNEIARRLKCRPSNNGLTRMTTDFIVVRSGQRVEAYSIKASRDVVEDREGDDQKVLKVKKRIRQLQMIEQIYWESQGVTWKQWFTDEMDRQKALNILDVITRYKWEPPMDDFAIIRYLIAHRIIEVNMSEKIEYRRLIDSLKGSEIWKTLKAS